MSSTLIAIDPLQEKDKQSLPSDFAGIHGTRHVDDTAFLGQVERILQSAELSGCEVLRRLLKYLAERTVSGEADELKEYTVAIDGLGKPLSYDPRQSSAVRIQAGRLRQKLIDYYRSEGIDDAVVVQLPKGHFRLSYRYSTTATKEEKESHEPSVSPEVEHTVALPIRKKLKFIPVLWIALASLALNLYFWTRSLGSAHAGDTSTFSELSPAMKDLWSPFVNSNRPLMLVLEDPLFVEFHTGNGIYYRDKKSGNTWEAAQNSKVVKKLRMDLDNPDIGPSHYYTAFGEAHAAFVIGRLFGARNQNFFTLARASDISSSQLAANNILAVGIPTTMFEDQLHEMPIQTQLQFVAEGIRNLHPTAGEPELYSDHFSTAPTEEGVAYALVSRLPGPERNTDVESFVGNRSAAYVAAVEAFADPNFARDVVSKLRVQSGGQMPRYFQVILKVTFKNSVPTDTTCVLEKELR